MGQRKSKVESLKILELKMVERGSVFTRATNWLDDLMWVPTSLDHLQTQGCEQGERYISYHWWDGNVCEKTSRNRGRARAKPAGVLVGALVTKGHIQLLDSKGGNSNKNKTSREEKALKVNGKFFIVQFSNHLLSTYDVSATVLGDESEKVPDSKKS